MLHIHGSVVSFVLCMSAARVKSGRGAPQGGGEHTSDKPTFALLKEETFRARRTCMSVPARVAPHTILICDEHQRSTVAIGYEHLLLLTAGQGAFLAFIFISA
jgi:hypothetical protein